MERANSSYHIHVAAMYNLSVYSQLSPMLFHLPFAVSSVIMGNPYPHGHSRTFRILLLNIMYIYTSDISSDASYNIRGQRVA